MNEEVIEDLKQFITVTVSRQVSGPRVDLREDIVGDLRTDIKNLDEKLSKKIDDLSDSVAKAIGISNDTVDTQPKDHGKRISKLEQKVA